MLLKNGRNRFPQSRMFGIVWQRDVRLIGSLSGLCSLAMQRQRVTGRKRMKKRRSYLDVVNERNRSPVRYDR
jgi:hypothetical protein